MKYRALGLLCLSCFALSVILPASGEDANAGKLATTLGRPSINGELAKSATATGCKARLVRNFFTMSASER